MWSSPEGWMPEKMRISAQRYTQLLDVATAAAERAASYLRKIAPAPPSEWAEKGRNDFVTATDRAAEELIAEELTRAEPGSRVMGEELSPEPLRSEGIVWVVDP